MKTLLLIEDEEDIAALIKLQGELAGYKVLLAAEGQQGYNTLQKEKPDLILLDLMLPGENGLAICRTLKSNPAYQAIPVIMLTAKGEESDIVLGLEVGADDYVVKPFSPQVLFSRIKAVLRRQSDSSSHFAFGEYALESDRYMLKKGNKSIPLTLSEFSILKRLLLHRGRVLTRNQLIEDIHDDDEAIIDRNIDVHVASLRKKLGPHFDWIETVRGVGYRFRE